MNSRKVLKKALHGCDREAVAKSMGIHVGSLNNQVAGERPYQPKGDTLNFVDRVVNFIDETYEQTSKMILLEEIAEEFGFLLIQNPTIKAAQTPAINKITEILKDFSSVIDEIAKANEDLVIEKYEGQKIRSKWEIFKRITEEFVLACETGVYEKQG